nr:unnamed protein product [Digitaria exilis]
MAPPRRAYLHLPLALLLLPCFCLLLLLRGAAAQPQQPAAGDAPQLLAIKAAWGDPPVLAAWNATAAAALCAWPYVGCDAAGRVANLTLANTNVTGPIPDAIGNLTGLTLLDVSNNNINGSFPTALYRCRSLLYLNLSQNYLAGVLPADIGSGLGENLTTLDLNGNYFNGTIPASLSGLRNLQFLALNGNRFTGTIPADLGELTNLQYLYVAYNPFDAGQLPGSFKNLTNLVGLYATQCNFVGEFPNFVWSFKNLQMLSLYTNNFSGDLVVDGSFAAYSLTLIDISVNNISGVIPEVFGRLDNLTSLIIFTNNFHGDIPASIGQLPSLQVLRIYGNRLTGTLPPELGKHSPGLNRIEADFNELTGPIPEGLCAGGQFQWFTAKGNNLNGSIPAGLANCTTLYRLQLDSNNLTGDVPQTLWTAAQLQLLQLPNNQLTGSLPATMGKRRRVAEEDGWKLTPFVQDLGFGDASILRGLKEENVVGRGGSGRVYRVTYTNRLNGRAGAVAVKQILTAGKLNEKMEREFESEAGILGNLRHINIVRLVCCLSNAESKLLVYDYMDNGSLDTWLHGEALVSGGHPMARARSARREQLDWPTRLKVAVGAAQGLSYMHHECEPPIVHRDVKTSNILLDSEFRAKVADFGLARMLVQAGAPETMSAVAGSFGYMAPECAYTKKVNEKVDVYSFGVVLLELTTGKEANDGGEHGSLAKWARHHCQSEGSIADATDKSIRYAGYSNEIEVVFRLGVLCTADMPSKRPTMKGVLQILVECSEQTHHKSKTERVPEYDAAPLLLPHHGSRRKQLSNGSGIDIEEKSDFDSIV